MTAAIITL